MLFPTKILVAASSKQALQPAGSSRLVPSPQHWEGPQERDGVGSFHLQNRHPGPTDGAGKLSASPKAVLHILCTTFPQNHNPKDVRRGRGASVRSHRDITPGLGRQRRTEQQNRMEQGTAISQLPCSKCFQLRRTMQAPPSRDAGRRKHQQG